MREGKLVDVRRRYRKREHDNQSGCTRGKREVESPARHEAAREWEAEAPCQDATQQPAGANKGGG